MLVRLGYVEVEVFLGTLVPLMSVLKFTLDLRMKYEREFIIIEDTADSV